MKIFTRFMLIILFCPFSRNNYAYADTTSPTLEVMGLMKEWEPILDQFKATQSLQSSFIEERYRPFRRIPSRFEGTIRIDPIYGISFIYTEPSPSLLHFYKGVLYRRSGSEELERLDYPEAVQMMNWLRHILVWDAQWFESAVTLSGSRNDDSNEWSIVLTPLNSQESPVNEIELAGAELNLEKINISNGPGKRIVISLLDSQLNPVFEDSQVKEFFPAVER